MDSRENQKYELLSDLAGADQRKYRRLKREAQRAGGYSRFGDDEYVDRAAVLAYHQRRQELAREAREEKKISREGSTNRYAHIDSLRRIDVIVGKISKAIDERAPKMDSILDQINSGVDAAKRGELSDQWDLLSIANQKSELKLQDALTRRKEIETEQRERIEVALKARSSTVSPVDATTQSEEEDQ